MMIFEFPELCLIIHWNAENVAREPLPYYKNSRGYTTPLNLKLCSGLQGRRMSARVMSFVVREGVEPWSM